jgi:hypothetical protein
MQRLHGNGADIETKGPEAESLVIIAGMYGHVHIVFWLIHDVRLDVYAVNIKGDTVAHIAARRGEINIIKLIYFYCKFDLTLINGNGQTPYECIPQGLENEREMRDFIIMVLSPVAMQQSVYRYSIEGEAFRVRRSLVKMGLITAANAAEVIPL